MLGLKDAHRNEPIYLCGTHAEEIGLSTAAKKGGNKSPESTPVRNSSKTPAANANNAINGRRSQRYLYILLVVAGLAFAGGLFGSKLFRRTPPRSRKSAATAGTPKRMESPALPQKAPGKIQAALPQGRSPSAPKKNIRLHTRSLQVANVTVKGTIAAQALPNVPRDASNTIRGTIIVSVRVQVDASGNVTHTDLVVSGPSRYFARLAVEAAQRWKFNPPVVDGKRSQSEWLIRFYYTREATRADATEDVKNVSAGTPAK